MVNVICYVIVAVAIVLGISDIVCDIRDRRRRDCPPAAPRGPSAAAE